MRNPSLFFRLSRLGLLGFSLFLFGCVTSSGPDPSEGGSVASPSVRPAPAPPPPSYSPPAERAVEPPPPLAADRVVFFSEPNFRGESFIVEAGAAVEDLAQLPRQRGSWRNAIASFRIEGVATVVAYTDAGFRGARLETSSSLADLVAESRGGAIDGRWEHAIASLRVVLPQPQVFIPAAPRYDRRAAENIVQRAYRDLLGRNADADGLRSYREKLMEQGWSEDEVRRHIRCSGEFHALNPDEVVTKAFREVLKREPDAEGLRHYRDLLVNEGWTIPQLRADLLRSDERSDKHILAVITKAYRDILGRDPDPEGLANYQRAVRDKAWDERQIRESLARSAEARARQNK